MQQGMQEYDKCNEEELLASLIDIAVEAWRLENALGRFLNSLNAREQSRYVGKIRWFGKRVSEALEKAGCVLRSCEGMFWDNGIAATPLNLGEFQASDRLIVDHMIEPIVIDNTGRVIHAGIVTLRKV